MESPITSQCCKLQLFITQKLSGQPGRLNPDLKLDCYGVFRPLLALSPNQIAAEALMTLMLPG